MSHKIAINQARVLVIDDEPEITDIVETFLSESGYTVGVETAPRRRLKQRASFSRI